MKKINKTIIYLILIIGLISFVFAQQPTLLSLQGKLTNTSTGAKIMSSDLRINITDSSKNLIFNHSFSNAVSNGMFDLLLGSTYYLNLSYNEDYNLSIYVGDSDVPVGGPYWFRGGQGEIGAGDIASSESFTFGNVTVIGSVNISDSLNVSNTVQATTFIGDGSLLSGINTDFTNLSDINVTNFVANNTLFVNGSRVGIGTSSPREELTVVGNINATENISLSGILKMGTFFARPSCIAGEAGGLIFDTNNSKPYVCNGSEWKPLDSDYDSDGIVDWNDQDDSNASVIHPNLTSANIANNVTIFNVTGNRSGEVFLEDGNWTKPPGVNAVLVIVGGGGGGGGGGNPSGYGGTGGSGGEVQILEVDVNNVTNLTVTIGAGGAGGAAGSNGVAGGTSSFSEFLSSVGGNGGKINAVVYSVGHGSGDGGWTPKPGFLGHGGTDGSSGDGGGSAGGGSYGDGGDGGSVTSSNGSPGVNGGGGGGGGYLADGANGGNGIVIVIPMDYKGVLP